jgi:hypothetical protein
MARIWIAILAVTRLTMESSNNDWMNCIDDPKRLGTNLAFAAMTIVCMGMCSAHGNKDADDTGERHSSQHCGKISRTVHSVLHWFVRRILVDGATPGLGSDDNGLDHADAAAVDDANRQGPADGPVFGRPPCSPSPESSSVQQMLRAGAVSAQQPTEQRYCALVGGLPGSLPPPGVKPPDGAGGIGAGAVCAGGVGAGGAGGAVGAGGGGFGMPTGAGCGGRGPPIGTRPGYG